MVDHSNSPGVTPEELAAVGLDPALAVAGGILSERPTIMCIHCGCSFVLHDRARPRCSKCDDYICDACAGNFYCFPVNKQIDLILGSDKPINPLILPAHLKPPSSIGEPPL